MMVTAVLTAVDVLGAGPRDSSGTGPVGPMPLFITDAGPLFDAAAAALPLTLIAAPTAVWTEGEWLNCNAAPLRPGKVLLVCSPRFWFDAAASALLPTLTAVLTVFWRTGARLS